MYVDEVGNSDLKASLSNENHRYLSLTGVIVELGYAGALLQPQLEDLKRRYFGSHPDDPVILHRKELVNQKPPFHALLDPDVKRAFDTELLQLLQTLDYVVITAVIDKLAHLGRYLMFLRTRNAVGDVMAESRGRREDRRLEDEYTRIYREGTSFVPHANFVERLTSSQLKVKPKSANVAGLQLADLIAHPSYVATKAARLNHPLPTNFGGS